MKKLKLNLEDLKVVSFETTSDTQQKQKGTVYGFGSANTNGDCTEVGCYPTGCFPATCPNQCSQYYTCQTCGRYCN